MPPIFFLFVSNGYKKMVIKQHFCTFGRNDRYRPRSLCPSTWSFGSHVNPCPPESAPVPTWVPGRRVPFSAAQSRPPAPRPVLLGLSRLGQACLSHLACNLFSNPVASTWSACPGSDCVSPPSLVRKVPQPPRWPLRFCASSPYIRTQPCIPRDPFKIYVTS